MGLFNFNFLYNLKSDLKVTKKSTQPRKKRSFGRKTKNRPTYGDFGFHGVRSPTSPKFKTHKIFVLHGFLLYTYISIPKLYTILLSRDLKTKKVRHPHPHPHQHQNKKKKKVFGYKSEILIKYKRIKWTPSRKAS